MENMIVNEKSSATNFTDTAKRTSISRKRRQNILRIRIALANLLSGSYWLGSSDFAARIARDASQIASAELIASCIIVSLLIFSAISLHADL